LYVKRIASSTQPPISLLSNESFRLVAVIGKIFESLPMFAMFTRGVEALRQPDRSPRCYELTDNEKLVKVKEWQARNVWNSPELALQDKFNQHVSA
jgi:hypothetical protein